MIGGGVIGSWTALHLARAGSSCTLLEQFPIPHTRGSSHGASRVIRLLGDDNLAALEFSYAEWKEMERLTGETLLVQTGLINLGTPDDEYLAKYMDIVRAGGYDTEWIDEGDLRTRFPFINYHGLGAASDPSGSILLAHKCVTAVQREFVRLGGRRIFNPKSFTLTLTITLTLPRGRIVAACAEKVTPLGEDAVQVIARYPGGELNTTTFHKVAVCAGPWSKQLLPACAHLLSAQCIPVTYWRERQPVDQEGYKHSVAAGFPVIFNARPNHKPEMETRSML